MTDKEITEEEIATHDKDSDCWIILGNDSNGKFCWVYFDSFVLCSFFFLFSFLSF